MIGAIEPVPASVQGGCPFPFEVERDPKVGASETESQDYRRYFRIADMTVQVESDLPITARTFRPKFGQFQVDKPGDDVIHILHRFALPVIEGVDLGRRVYCQLPWEIYIKDGSWTYLSIAPDSPKPRVYQIASFSSDYARSVVYNDAEGAERFAMGGLDSLSLFPTDQIWLAQILAHRNGCLLHSCGVNLDGKGLLFVGHSSAGKSTIASMLKSRADILCDDRMIVRHWPDGFRIHGTWSHGDVPIVSAASAPLQAILFLDQAEENRVVALKSSNEVIGRLLSCLIKPLVTADWWHRELDLIEHLAAQVPAYVLRFDLSGGVISLLEQLV